MRMSVECWWSGADGARREVPGLKPVPIPLRLSQIARNGPA